MLSLLKLFMSFHLLTNILIYVRSAVELLWRDSLRPSPALLRIESNLPPHLHPTHCPLFSLLSAPGLTPIVCCFRSRCSRSALRFYSPIHSSSLNTSWQISFKHKNLLKSSITLLHPLRSIWFSISCWVALSNALKRTGTCHVEGYLLEGQSRLTRACVCVTSQLFEYGVTTACAAANAQVVITLM